MIRASIRPSATPCWPVPGATVLSCLLGFASPGSCREPIMPGRRWFEILNLVPFFLSPYVGAVGWIYLAAPNSGMLQHWLGVLGIPLDFIRIYSIGGVIWVLALFYTPYVYLFVIAPMRQMDAALEDAARVHGASFWYTLRHMTIPLLMPRCCRARWWCSSRVRACSTCHWRWPQPAASAPCRRRSSSRCNTRRISVARRPSASWSWRRRSACHPAAAISRQAPVRNRQREGLSAPADPVALARPGGGAHARGSSTSPAASCCPHWPW